MKAVSIVLALATAGIGAAHASNEPWADDQALLRKCEADLSARGVLGLVSEVADVEGALSREKQTRDLAAAHDPVIVLADGTAESLIATAAVATAREQAHAANLSVVAVDDPYPALAFYLASYYNETRRPEDALHVLDLQLAFDEGTSLGEHRMYLVSERGAALMALKRWDDVLANEDNGLKFDNLDPGVKARLLRGRGYALTELNRLDEAEGAYRDSLKLDPDSELAKHELDYIAQLQRGGDRAPSGELKSVQKPGQDKSQP